MNVQVKNISHNELISGCIVLKNNEPIIITNEIIIDLLQHPELYSPIIITDELLEKFGFSKSINPINKDVYFDIGDSSARIIHDSKRNDFRMNFHYTIKRPDRHLEAGLGLSQLNQLQFFLIYFYGIELNPELLLRDLI